MGNIQLDLEKAKEAVHKKEFEAARLICIEALKENEARLSDRSAMKERLEILLMLTDICKNQDRLFDNINYLGQLVKGARAIGDHEMLAKGLIRTGFVFNKMGKRDRAMDKFNEAEEITWNLENKVQYGYVLAGKANIYWRTGENERAIKLAKDVLEIGLENNEYILTAGAANILSSAFFELADFDEALKAAKMSVATYRNQGNKSDLARALNNQGEIYKRMREYDRAIESYEMGMAVLESGTVKRFGYLYTNMSECQTRKGDLVGAEASLEKARQFLDGSEDRYAVACMWFATGLLAGAKGDVGKGVEWLEKAEKRMDELGVPYDLGNIRLELARLLMRSGREEAAAEMVVKATAALQKAGAKDLIKEASELTY